MNKIEYYLVFLSICFLSFTNYSQTNESYFTDKKDENVNTSIILNSNLNNSLLNLNQDSRVAVSQINSVNLTQIGINNVSDISQSQQTSQSVKQFGRNNYYSYIDFRNSNPINLEVLQQGNSNSLQIYGSNSLSNGMKIVQKSNFKNIVIKNYK